MPSPSSCCMESHALLGLPIVDISSFLNALAWEECHAPCSSLVDCQLASSQRPVVPSPLYPTPVLSWQIRSKDNVNLTHRRYVEDPILETIICHLDDFGGFLSFQKIQLKSPYMRNSYLYRCHNTNANPARCQCVTCKWTMDPNIKHDLL